MKPRRFFWEIFPSFVTMVAIAVALMLGGAVFSLRRYQLQQTKRELTVAATLVAKVLKPAILAGDASAVTSACRWLDSSVHIRCTVVSPNGVMIGESEKHTDSMENQAGWPEIAAVLKGASMGSSVRLNHTLNSNLVYVAIPFTVGDSLVAVVRVAKPRQSIFGSLNATLGAVLTIACFIVAAASLIAVVLSRRLSIPIEELTQGAERLARSDFSSRLAVPQIYELGRLAEAMNAMVTELASRIDALTLQRNEQEAILSCMAEGVVAVSADEKLLLINPSAARMLGIDAQSARGRLLHEAIRNSDVQRFVRKALSMESNHIEEGEVRLIGQSPNDDRVLQVHGTVLRDSHDKIMGAMIVCNDVTRLKRLESIRRDFVANVSHELRTPLTSIQGFVETLLGGDEGPEERRRFLEIIASHTQRLNALIEDLLLLSRIENEAEREGLKLVQTRLAPIIQEAAEVCAIKARQKRITIDISCDPSLQAHINAFLFQQALINLIDNAVKYSEPATTVRIEGRKANGEVTVAVIDHGPGIAPEHLPRIFERFYRIDKSRSRKLGGTGLGLSIVKHIMQSHHGSVEVQSELGKGSTFILRLQA